MMRGSLTIQLASLLLLALATTLSNAAPSAKKCSSQTGSDELGVPTVDERFYAMSYLWRNNSDIEDGFFEVTGDKIIVNVPSNSFGFFAITSSGYVSQASNSQYQSDCRICMPVQTSY